MMTPELEREAWAILQRPSSDPRPQYEAATAMHGKALQNRQEVIRPRLRAMFLIGNAWAAETAEATEAARRTEGR